MIPAGFNFTRPAGPATLRVMNTFLELDLHPYILKSLEEMKFVKPTPIQAKAIPLAFTGQDLIGTAQTGTGKTAAFSIPILTKLLADPQATALILAPTRELAVQITHFIRDLIGKMTGVQVTLLIGGVPLKRQVELLKKKPRILVATPGRLLDHLKSRKVSLDNCKILVLDEADRMLDMGFAPQLREIRRFLPKHRQTMLFTATMPSDMMKLSQDYLKNPVKVSAGDNSKPIKKIVQSVIETPQHLKQKVLLEQLQKREGSVLIFLRTKHRTDKLAKFLRNERFRVARIHGDRSQSQRESAIEGFRSGEFRILVATDIAARGLDISNIAHVINYDLPQMPEDYVHRIGRTARNGAEGESISLVTPEDKKAWRAIEKLIQS